MMSDPVQDKSAIGFEQRIAEQDISLFDAIPAELTDADKQSLLLLQRIVRQKAQSYRYLEIGSHLGGSIQPHLLDDRCEVIHSIDPRPSAYKDGRGSRFHYPNNSTERMLRKLSQIADDRVFKVRTYETNAAELASGEWTSPVDLVFIDGEHTDDAALSDFDAAMRFGAPDAMIVFHDAPIVHRAITKALRTLCDMGVERSCFTMPDTLFVIVIGDKDALARPEFAPAVSGAAHAYLRALGLTDGYRRFYLLPVFRWARSVLIRLGFSRLANRYGYAMDEGGALG